MIALNLPERNSPCQANVPLLPRLILCYVIPESREAGFLESRQAEQSWIPEFAAQLWNDV